MEKDVEYVGYEFWTDAFVAPFKNRLSMRVPDRDCRIIAVRPLSNDPQVLSTSRHITQGLIDLIHEAWNEDDQTLSGRSTVVANDPYELRIAAGQPGIPLTCSGLSVSAEDLEAGVKIKLVSQDGWKLKILITSPVSRDVKWNVKLGAK